MATLRVRLLEQVEKTPGRTAYELAVALDADVDMVANTLVQLSKQHLVYRLERTPDPQATRPRRHGYEYFPIEEWHRR